MTLWLTQAQVNAILAHALRDAPREACGLIAGAGIRAEMVVAASNVADDPERRFVMGPVELARWLPEFEACGLELLGFYHSHPAGPPIPSPADIQSCCYPDAVHVIVGMSNTYPELGAWKIRNFRVDPVKLHVGDEAPLDLEEAPVSRAQGAAILLSATIALLLLLALALYLLPPAPVTGP